MTKWKGCLKWKWVRDALDAHGPHTAAVWLPDKGLLSIYSRPLQKWIDIRQPNQGRKAT